MRRALIARLDSMGDVLLCGPAVRAVAASPDIDEVWMLCSSVGAAAAKTLPNVDRVLIWDCPWIAMTAPPVTSEHMAHLIDLLKTARADVAIILTSFHQSPLPLALQLRLAGIPFIVGASVDYAGSLLDVRLKPGEDFFEDQPEPERALTIVAAAGFSLPPEDTGKLQMNFPTPPAELIVDGHYVVVHPGAAAASRRWPAQSYAAAVKHLHDAGVNVVVTGDHSERELTSFVSGHGSFARDLGGLTDLSVLASVLAGADVIVVGNTGAAHIAAAVGTAVVSLFSPVVPAIKWAPYRVEHVLLGDQQAPCRDSRARDCPVPGHPCLTLVSPDEVLDAVFSLAPGLDLTRRGIKA